jgi:hypothetical protein
MWRQSDSECNCIPPTLWSVSETLILTPEVMDELDLV